MSYLICFRAWTGFGKDFPAERFMLVPDDGVIPALREAAEGALAADPELTKQWEAACRKYREEVPVAAERNQKYNITVPNHPDIHLLPTLETETGLMLALAEMGWVEWVRKPGETNHVLHTLSPSRYVIAATELEMHAQLVAEVLNKDELCKPRNRLHFSYFDDAGCDLVQKLQWRQELKSLVRDVADPAKQLPPTAVRFDFKFHLAAAGLLTELEPARPSSTLAPHVATVSPEAEAQSSSMGVDTSGWLTVSDAAEKAHADPGVISRACNDGALKAVGTRKDRRIEPASFDNWNKVRRLRSELNAATDKPAPSGRNKKNKQALQFVMCRGCSETISRTEWEVKDRCPKCGSSSYEHHGAELRK